MGKFFLRFLSWLIAGTVVLTLAACYGAPIQRSQDQADDAVQTDTGR